MLNTFKSVHMCLCSNRFQIPRRTTDQFRVLCVLSSRPQFLIIFFFFGLTNYYAKAKKRRDSQRGCEFSKETRSEKTRRRRTHNSTEDKTSVNGGHSLSHELFLHWSQVQVQVSSYPPYHISHNLITLPNIHRFIYILCAWLLIFVVLGFLFFSLFFVVCYFYGFSALITDWDINLCVLFLMPWSAAAVSLLTKKWFDQIMRFDRFPFDSLALPDSIWSSGESLAPKEKRICKEWGER